MPTGVGCLGMPVETGVVAIGVPLVIDGGVLASIETTMISGPDGGFGTSFLAWSLEVPLPVFVPAPESLLRRLRA